jgi:hypothetical protein
MRTAEGSRWFRRLRKELRQISPHIRLVRIKMGFYRIFWKNAYIHEIYKDMPQKGYDVERLDPRLTNQSYYEEFEDNVEVIRTVKNFVEGYYDSIATIKTRSFMMKNNKEFNETSRNAYKQFVVK